MLTAAPENIRFARTAPLTHPAICTGRYASACRHGRPPNVASTKDTTGLKCAPLTGPNIRTIANRRAAVAAAFSVRIHRGSGEGFLGVGEQVAELGGRGDASGERGQARGIEGQGKGGVVVRRS